MTPEVEKLVHAAARVAVAAVPKDAPPDGYVQGPFLVRDILALREATQAVLTADAQIRGGGP